MTKIELEVSKIFERYFLIIEKEYNINNINNIKKKTFNNIKSISTKKKSKKLFISNK
jgi:hypothetical protein